MLDLDESMVEEKDATWTEEVEELVQEPVQVEPVLYECIDID